MIYFDFSRDVVEAFSCGDCNWLAWALHNEFGYDIIALCEEQENGEQDWWRHFVCVLPSGQVFDIEGVYSKDEIASKWGCELRSTSFSRELCESIIIGQEKVYPDYDAWEYVADVQDALRSHGLVA